MKQSDKVAIYLASAAMLGASASAVTAEPQGNPYQGIVERNVFALKPPPDPESLKPAAPPPPLIELQGISSMFGRQQVLFRTQKPAKPPKPPEKVSMVLSVGQRVDDIEVVSIDEQAGLVTFNNHGVVQPLNLTNDAVKLPTGPAAAPLPGIGQVPVPGVPPPVAGFNPTPNAPGGVTTFGGPAVKQIPTRTLRLPSSPGGNVSPQMSSIGVPAASPPPAAITPAPQTTTQPPLSPEEQAALMLIQKAQNPEGPPIPPFMQE